jgi:hypothetical protein
MPACERTGVRCFIACSHCLDKVETDEIGPLKSVTVRVNQRLSA